MSQLLVALVGWKVQLVKAEDEKQNITVLKFCSFEPSTNICALSTCSPSVSRWQAVSGSIITVDLELLDAVHAFQSCKTLEGNLGCASDKLQELGPVCLIK